MMTLILLHWSQTLRFFTILTPPQPRQSQPDEVAQPGPLFPVLILAPLAGLVSAPLAALAGWLALAASFPPITAGLVALFCLIWISGGLHEDGLGDYMDGIGAGGTAHARLSIMRDSRIGAYGAIGLIMAIGLQAGLIGQIGDQTGLAGFMAVMLACEL
ncbi:MAG: adenosylcobinamide-GDP ribazoletransferase, partial [Pseudomonadota bacterium]